MAPPKRVRSSGRNEAVYSFQSKPKAKLTAESAIGDFSAATSPEMLAEALWASVVCDE